MTNVSKTAHLRLTRVGSRPRTCAYQHYSSPTPCSLVVLSTYSYLRFIVAMNFKDVENDRNVEDDDVTTSTTSANAVCGHGYVYSCTRCPRIFLFGEQCGSIIRIARPKDMPDKVCTRVRYSSIDRSIDLSHFNGMERNKREQKEDREAKLHQAYLISMI